MSNCFKVEASLSFFSGTQIIYLDKERRDIVLAVRGLDMTSVDDFNILEDNYRGQQAYMDGYVHAGFYKVGFSALQTAH